MIKIIVELLNNDNLWSKSEVIDIAKGKNQYPRNMKEIYKKFKIEKEWQRKQ